MTQPIICPACLKTGESQRNAVAGFIVLGIGLPLLALGIFACFFGNALMGIIIGIIGAILAHLGRKNLQEKFTCASCHGAALPLATPGGKAAWEKLKAQKSAKAQA